MAIPVQIHDRICYYYFPHSFQHTDKNLLGTKILGALFCLCGLLKVSRSPAIVIVVSESSEIQEVRKILLKIIT